MVKKLRRVLLLLLLAPVLPILGLSPFSHAYVNRLALRKARDEEDKGNPRVNRELLQLLSKHEREFVNAGNSADAISTYHVLNGIDLYDYAHNYHPDHAQGVPRFGYTLVNEWYENRSKYPEHHVAIAAGWLAHQLADWCPHYACIRDNGELDDDPTRVADGLSTFAGFANALTIFGADLPAEFRERYKVPNHGLYELFLDTIVLASDEGKGLYGTRVNLFDHEKYPCGLLTRCSERFRAEGFVRIPPEHVPSLERDFNTIILGTGVLIKFLLKACPDLCRDLESFVKTDVLELAADKVFEGLFCKSWDEFRNFSAGSVEQRDAGSVNGPLVGLSSEKLTAPGSALFSILYQIGGSFRRDVSPDDLARLIDEPAEAVLSQIPRVGKIAPAIDSILESFGRDMDTALYRLLREKLRRLGGSSKGKWKDQSPILAFLSGLLLDAEGDISSARKAMRFGLRPIISVCGTHNQDSDSELANMFARRKIHLRAIPAVANSYPQDLKALKQLDENTLTIRIDGYDLKQDAAIGTFTVSRDSRGALDISIEIKADVVPGVHHVFVDIKDNNGVHSEYLDRKIAVGRANTNGTPS